MMHIASPWTETRGPEIYQTVTTTRPFAQNWEVKQGDMREPLSQNCCQLQFVLLIFTDGDAYVLQWIIRRRRSDYIC